MRIDIKSIANALSSGVSEIKNTSGTVNIREALGEAAEEPKLEELSEKRQPQEDSEHQEEGSELTQKEHSDAENGEEREDFPGETEQGQVEVVKEVEASEEAEESQIQPEDVADDNSEGEEMSPAEENESEEDEPEEDESEREPSAKPEKSEAEQNEAVAAVEEDSQEDKMIREADPKNNVTTAETLPQPSSIKEKLFTWGGKYGWLTGIAVSFLILIAFMVIYTTMTPREITAVIDGEKCVLTTEEYTVEGFLEEEKIAICEEDYLSVPLSTFIQDGISFELKHATDFAVTADGKIKKYKSLDATVQQALDDVGIEVGKLDIVKPAQDAMLEQNMHIVIKRVEIKKEVREEKVAFETIEKDDVTMNEGTTKVVTKGKNGKDKVTYEIKYIDGKEASKKEIDRETITAAVDEVIANGTRVNYNGKSYSKKLKVKAYSYTGGGTTAMGTRARVGEIAVDPSVIPLGTNVYIEGVGPRRAEDTGGNIKGNTIDIYMNSQAECIRWGVRYVTIYIE